ncbi:MAG TPA: gamma-glutamyltransferase, partial [Candidatus Binatia bacterium]|nr:gamma-glutamyltransferase [Candidatus Binatia bacterium]
MKFSKAARPVIMGRNGMVSSGHYLASLAGVEILKAGGNAVDAALAAAFVSAVVKPETSGPGGDLFALVYMKKTGKVEALNASGPAPAKATIDEFYRRGLKGIPQYGPLAIAVPGAVDGWLELHKKYGTMDLAHLTADAVRLGREGFPISQDFSEAVHEFAPEYPWVDKCYRQPLGAGKPGKVLVQPGLAGVFEKIARQGRAGFYAGEIADKICATIKAEGGLLGHEDLQPIVCQWLEPLVSSYRDTLVYEQPPVSQGFMVLEMLNIAEAWPFDNGTMSQAEILHYQIAAKKLAFEDRIQYLEDPAFGDPQVISRLISKQHAAKRRQLADEILRRPAASLSNQSSDTTYLCAADRDGNAISFI